MARTEDSVCPICTGFMTEHYLNLGWNRCSCGYARKIKMDNEIISLDHYFTDYMTKQDRREVYKDEFLPEYEDNAKLLLTAVSGLFNELGIDKNKPLTSGWRPPSVNGATPNAAKKSAHMICKAGDWLDDKNQTFAKLIASRPDLLRKYNLFLENPQFTKGKNTNWFHLDCMIRSDRPSRQFNP